MDDPDQFNEGVWMFTVGTSSPKTGYVWSRTVGGAFVETFASTASDALPFNDDTQLELVSPTQGFSNRDAFLSWACNQLGTQQPLTWWEYNSDVSSGTCSCGK